MSAVQNEIQTLLDRVVEEGRECGIQVAAYHHGALVVDAWAGRCDARRDTPVDGRTLFPVFSTTKGVAATVIHILAARGVFKYDDPIALYWPEFAQHGKEAITLRHVLTHSSGIPQLPADLSLEDAADWDRMCAIVAALPPLWRPGSKMEYHALTYGWILGEVARRATGTPFGELLDALVRTPLKLADLYIGCPAAVCARVAVLDEPTAAPLLPNESGHYTIPPALQPLYVWMNRPDAQRACNPAGSGVMSAQSIARHYAALVPGGVDGVSLLPETHVTA